jgi:hypothetical protein
MRAVTVAVALLAVFVAALACTALTVLSALDGADVALEPLVRGELRQLFASSTFWNVFPSWPHASLLLAFGPAVVVATLAALLGAAARRWPRCPAAVLAAGALLGGTIPYAVGAITLRGNTAPGVAGPWLVWMVVGPLYAASLSLGIVLRGAWARRAPRAVPAVAPAA